MDVTVQARDLAQAIAAARVVHDGKPARHFFLVGVGGHLAVAQAPEYTVLPLSLVRVPAEGVLPQEPVALPREPLREYLGTIRGMCRLRLDGGSVRLETERSQATFSTLADVQPYVPEVGEEVARLQPDEVTRARIVATACAKEDTRPALTVVWLEHGRLWASNGYRLATTPVQAATAEPVPIPPRFVTAAAAQGDETIVSRCEVGYAYTAGSLQLLGWGVGSKPPAFMTVWQNTTRQPVTAAVSVSAADIRKALRVRLQDATAFLYILGSRLRVVVRREDTQGEGILRADIDGTDGEGHGRRAVNARFLADAVADAATARVTFVGKDAEGPVLVTAAAEWVIMPILYDRSWPAQPEEGSEQ